jgi:hypothetical protein
MLNRICDARVLDFVLSFVYTRRMVLAPAVILTPIFYSHFAAMYVKKKFDCFAVVKKVMGCKSRG